LAPAAGERCNGILLIQKPMARMAKKLEEKGEKRNTMFRLFSMCCLLIQFSLGPKMVSWPPSVAAAPHSRKYEQTYVNIAWAVHI